MKTASSEAIDRTAQKVRESAQKSGTTLTHTEARDIVVAARERGDRIRDNRNR